MPESLDVTQEQTVQTSQDTEQETLGTWVGALAIAGGATVLALACIPHFVAKL